MVVGSAFPGGFLGRYVPHPLASERNNHNPQPSHMQEKSPGPGAVFSRFGRGAVVIAAHGEGVGTFLSEVVVVGSERGVECGGACQGLHSHD